MTTTAAPIGDCADGALFNYNEPILNKKRTTNKIIATADNVESAAACAAMCNAAGGPCVSFWYRGSLQRCKLFPSDGVLPDLTDATAGYYRRGESCRSRPTSTVVAATIAVGNGPIAVAAAVDSADDQNAHRVNVNVVDAPVVARIDVVESEEPARAKGKKAKAPKGPKKPKKAGTETALKVLKDSKKSKESAMTVVKQSRGTSPHGGAGVVATVAGLLGFGLAFVAVQKLKELKAASAAGAFPTLGLSSSVSLLHARDGMLMGRRYGVLDNDDLAKDGAAAAAAVAADDDRLIEEFEQFKHFKFASAKEGPALQM